MAYTGEIEARLSKVIYAAVEAEIKTIVEKHGGTYVKGMLATVDQNFQNATSLGLDSVASVIEDSIVEWESDTESNFGNEGFDGTKSL